MDSINTPESSEAANSHTSRRNSGSRNSCDWACSSWLNKYRLDAEEDNCSRRARARNWSLRVWNTIDTPVLKTGANFHKYKVKRSCRPKVRGCALNSVEHPHGGGNHQHCETVDHILASRSTRLEGQKKRSAKLLLSSQRAAQPWMWRWPRVWTKHVQDHWRRYRRRPHRHQFRNDLWAVHAHVKPFTEYPECSSSENSTPTLFACSESSYLKAYREDKQKASAAYSLSIVKAIQHVSCSRQYSQRGSDSEVKCERTLRIDQIVNTNRSRRGAGTHVYNPHLPDISSTSSNVWRLALWFLHHPAWVKGHTGGSRLTPTVHPCWLRSGGCGWPMYCMNPMYHRNTRNPHTCTFFWYMYIF